MLLIVALSSNFASAQSTNLQYQVANLMEDVRLLEERVRQMAIEIEDVRRENSRMRQLVEGYESRIGEQMNRFATVAQLNEGIRNAVAALETQDSVVKEEVIAHVTKTIADFAKKMETALGGLPVTPKNRPGVKTTFDMTNVPRTGVSYNVESGDTLSSIAAKLNSRVNWIQNANKISDPSILQIGQLLFIPQQAE